MPLTQTQGKLKEDQVEGYGVRPWSLDWSPGHFLYHSECWGFLEASAASHEHQCMIASWVLKVHEGLRPHCWCVVSWIEV